MLDYIILGFLLYGDMSGYDIKRFMTTSTANFYDASFGSIYPMLNKMEEQGLVCSKELVDGGKYRKVYSILPAGRAAFIEWLEQPIELNNYRHTHLVRIFFYGWLPTAKARSLVEAYIERMAEELAALNELERVIDADASFYQLSTLVFGKDYYVFTIDWCRKFLLRQSQLEQAGEQTSY